MHGFRAPLLHFVLAHVLLPVLCLVDHEDLADTAVGVSRHGRGGQGRGVIISHGVL